MQNLQFLIAYLVEFSITKIGDLCQDVQPYMEQRIEDDDPAVQCGYGKLEHALQDMGHIQLSQWDYAVGNGGLHVLLSDDQQGSQSCQKAQKIPAKYITAAYFSVECFQQPLGSSWLCSHLDVRTLFLGRRNLIFSKSFVYPAQKLQQESFRPWVLHAKRPSLST